MLNGGYSDFCLQSFDDSDSELDKIAWSSNVKNYLKIITDDVVIRNWYENKTEIVKKDKVISNFNQFYNYIFNKSYKTESDIVPFVIDLFNQLRNITQESSEPLEALNLLFTLLVSIEEDYNNIDKAIWGIRNVNLPHSFDYFVERIREGVKTAKPNLDLILRHSSGRLFQEANRNVISFNPQRDLFGGVSSKLITESIAYTSIHYTPQYLARTIVENCLNNLGLTTLNEISILDPSCGSSEFLIEILKQLKNINYTGNINIKGFDNSKNAIETSRFLLNYENRTQWNNSLKIDLRVVEDSLTEDWGINNVLLMNPPFTSFELIKDKEIKATIKSVLSDFVKSGRPNQASAFFLKAINSLSENAVFGCVLPSSIFTLDIYNSLRNHISEISNFKIIGKLGNYVFEDALTDVSIVVGTKNRISFSPKLIWTKNEKGIVQEALRELRKLQANNEIAVSKNSYSIYTPEKFPILENSWRIISLNENKFITDLNVYIGARKLVKLQEIFTVYQGALLGTKNVFTISKYEYLDYSDEEKIYFRPLLNNSAISKGSINITEYVWYPYDQNGLMIQDETELNQITFAQNNLLPNKLKLQQRSENREEWWALTRPRNWQFTKKKRLYSTRFGNSNSFGYDNIGDAVIIEGNAFFPKKEMSEEDLLFYLAVFSSDYFDYLLSIFSKQLAGGKWYDLGNNFIKKIPIPDVHSSFINKSEAYFKLVEIGKELSNGNTFVKTLSKNQLVKFYPEVRND
ncbi:MAG: N-6 DNA methylase [Bacteroidaceae bacterium]|nr:N-6 DNA methylase [Bacteroidaceae bacterium]